MSQPLLIDRIIEAGRNVAGGPVPKPFWNTLLKGRLNSERFIFSPEASRLLGTFAFNDGDLILKNRQFALPPYQNTYVEVDATEFFKDAKEDITPKENRDQQLAYMALGQNVYVMFGRPNESAIGVAFWRYNIVPPGQKARPNQLNVDLSGYKHDFGRWLKTKPEIWEMLRDRSDNFNPDSDDMYQETFRLNMYLGGSTPINTPKQYKDALQILDEVSGEWVLPEDHFVRKTFTVELLQRFYGDIRNYWAMMLWLNQPSRLNVIGTPAGRKIVRGKLMPYLRYNTVNITLGRAKTVRRAFQLANERKSPGAHKVREHWAHRGGWKSCTNYDTGHEWPLVADASGHFVCQHCKLRRWRVKEHQRGDAALGFVQKHYEVDAA